VIVAGRKIRVIVLHNLYPLALGDFIFAHPEPVNANLMGWFFIFIAI
jgi:hypothetical protein